MIFRTKTRQGQGMDSALRRRLVEARWPDYFYINVKSIAYAKQRRPLSVKVIRWGHLDLEMSLGEVLYP